MIEVKKIHFVVNDGKRFVQDNFKDSTKNFVFIHEIGPQDIDRVKNFLKGVLDMLEPKIEMAFVIVLRKK